MPYTETQVSTITNPSPQIEPVCYDGTSAWAEFRVTDCGEVDIGPTRLFTVDAASGETVDIASPDWSKVEPGYCPEITEDKIDVFKVADTSMSNVGVGKLGVTATLVWTKNTTPTKTIYGSYGSGSTAVAGVPLGFSQSIEADNRGTLTEGLYLNSLDPAAAWIVTTREAV